MTAFGWEMKNGMEDGEWKNIPTNMGIPILSFMSSNECEIELSNFIQFAK